jgi:hypothetical protein
MKEFKKYELKISRNTSNCFIVEIIADDVVVCRLSDEEAKEVGKPYNVSRNYHKTINCYKNTAAFLFKKYNLLKKSTLKTDEHSIKEFLSKNYINKFEEKAKYIDCLERDMFLYDEGALNISKEELLIRENQIKDFFEEHKNKAYYSLIFSEMIRKFKEIALDFVLQSEIDNELERRNLFNQKINNIIL